MKKYIIKQLRAIVVRHINNILGAIMLVAYAFMGHGVFLIAGFYFLLMHEIGLILDLVKKIPTKVTVGFQMQDNRLATLEHERMAWSWKTFPDGTARGALEKCREELMEVEVLLVHGSHDKDELATEYADALMCLMDSAQRAGLSVDEILNAYAKKHEINKTRTWKSNGSGNYSHVNTTEA
jgi:phosphoribosyl-ATP pyrophosphohydrolase